MQVWGNTPSIFRTILARSTELLPHRRPTPPTLRAHRGVLTIRIGLKNDASRH